ncbi:nucleotide sugar dehydrogenase [Bacillaceae bacterium]
MERKKQDVGVIGLGFVGLPLAMLFAKKGFSVVGVDLDKGKLAQLAKGISYLPDVDHREIRSLWESGRFVATDDHSKLRDVATIIICVPTPLTKEHKPDLHYLLEAGKAASEHLQRGQLVILESSTYPGTTREVLLPLLESGERKAGKDFFLAYSPERIDPGNADYPLEQIPKVLGGVTSECARRAIDLYRRVFARVVTVSSVETAELTKMLENIYRFVNISFINEMAVICDRMGVDVWEVIAAASTKPYGFSPFYPGPGVGGHCIPVDPLYFQWKAGEYGIKSRFIELCERVNREMPRYVVTRIKEMLYPENIAQARILLYGIAYKRDTGDIRESRALTIIELLREEGADVSYHDPYVPSLTIGDEFLQSVPLTKETLQMADCVVILTDHSAIPLREIIEYAPRVFDTRNVTGGWQGKGNILRLGEGRRREPSSRADPVQISINELA